MAVKLGRLNLVDKATIAYNAIVVLLLLCFAGRIPAWQSWIWLNLATILAIVFLFSRIGEQSGLVLRLIRNFYPMFCFFGAYQETERMNRIIFADFLDPFFQRLEYAIFGMQPALAFAERFPSWWLREYMHLAYFSYYALFPSLGLALYLRKDKSLFEEYMFVLCSSFYTYYLIFIAFPVAGGESIGLPSAPGDGPFTRIMQSIYAHFEVGGAAFPSSHVGIAVVVLAYALRCLPAGASAVYVLFGISLMLSTVYCRYHYAVDVITGIITGALFVFAWSTLHRRLKRSGRFINS